MQQYNVIGLMSGSSLDGVDLCYAEFYLHNEQWLYKNMLVETIAYDDNWTKNLLSIANAKAAVFCRTNAEYGHFLGRMIKEFIKRNDLVVHLIASHGHTIFHQPHVHFTTQIGDGAAIYAETGIKTVNDFRVVDVALGGQGAPLVPVGERDLFEQYGMFLNLGGIANITIFDKFNKIMAFDIAPCNMALNMLCEKYFNQSFDHNGTIAMKGTLNENLFASLKNLDYFQRQPPKSLGREFMLESYFPCIEQFDIPAADKLFTVNSHISYELSRVINQYLDVSRHKSILVSGGGAYNTSLLQMLQHLCDTEISIPTSEIIEFKEALIFAYLGLLRFTGQPNALASVTHARYDSIGGALWG